MSYEKIIEKLKANHFLSATEITVGKDKSVITGVRVEAAPILQESKKNRILEVLEGFDVSIERNTKDGCLVIRIND